MKRFGKWYFEMLFTVGLILSAVVMMDRIYDFLNMFMKGMFTSLSIGLLLVAGTLRLNKRFQKKMDVAMSDERIQMIAGKSADITIVIMTFVMIVATIVLGFFGEPYIYVSLLLTAVMALQVLILCVVKAVVSKKM